MSGGSNKRRSTPFVLEPALAVDNKPGSMRQKKVFVGKRFAIDRFAYVHHVRYEHCRQKRESCSVPPVPSRCVKSPPWHMKSRIMR